MAAIDRYESELTNQRTAYSVFRKKQNTTQHTTQHQYSRKDGTLSDQFPSYIHHFNDVIALTKGLEIAVYHRII